MIINVKVIPRSSKNKIEKIENGYKVWLKSPPVDGKANEELINFLSEVFNKKPSEIAILKGKNSKMKTIKIPD